MTIGHNIICIMRGDLKIKSASFALSSKMLMIKNDFIWFKLASLIAGPLQYNTAEPGNSARLLHFSATRKHD